MKLETLLKQITPLPWPINEYGSILNGKHALRDKVCVTGFALAQGSDTTEADFNNRYVHHASNVLPELVIAARQFQYAVLRNGQAGQEMINRLQSALDAAEEVKTT